MGVYEEEIKDREFDWYAVDCESNIALFSTAGEGFIPQKVIDNFVSHDCVTDTLVSPNSGTSNVWQDYASKGMFVFNWCLPGGPYKKVIIPKDLISPELKKKILKVAFKINTNFYDTEEISKA